MKCQPSLCPKTFRIGREIGRELFIAWLYGGHVLDEESHLLPHASPNDHVVAVQARRSALTIENLVANVIVDEALQFLPGWRSPPSAGEAIRERGDALRGNDDLRGCFCVILADYA